MTRGGGGPQTISNGMFDKNFNIYHQKLLRASLSVHKVGWECTDVIVIRYRLSRC